eukprot:4762872-Ditylum_brightwellii.AAC.1
MKNNTPTPFDHYGVKSLTIKKPATEKTFNETARQYKTYVEVPSEQWMGVSKAGVRADLTRVNFDQIIRHKDITAVVYCGELSSNKGWLDLLTDNPFKAVLKLSSLVSTDLMQSPEKQVICYLVYRALHQLNVPHETWTPHAMTRPHITNLAGAACKKYKSPKAAFTAHPQLLVVYEQEFASAQQKLETKVAEDNGTKHKWSNNQQHQTT